MPPIEPEKQPETASWLRIKKPGIIRSIRGYFREKSLELLDGTYFGLNGQNLVSIDDFGNLGGFFAEEQMIIANNAGIQRQSSFLSTITSGSSLFCFVEGKGWTQMEQIEATNEGFVREVTYPKAASYIGQTGVGQILQEILTRPDKREEFASSFGIPSSQLLEMLSQPVYQVKKEGHRKVIVSDFEIDRPEQGPVGMRYKF